MLYTTELDIGLFLKLVLMQLTLGWFFNYVVKHGGWRLKNLRKENLHSIFHGFLPTKSFFVIIISDNVYFIHSYRNLKEKTEIQIPNTWYTWYLPWWHVMSLWSAWHAATSRDTSQRHTGCRNPHCRLAHYITLHYITLHYITLHYITAQIVPSAGQCTGSKRALFLHN